MTPAQAMILAGIVLISHELKPAPRMVIGLVVGLWGVIFGLASIIF